MSASAVRARQGRDAPMRLGAQPADAAPPGRRQNFLVSAGLADATARVHLNRYVRPICVLSPTRSDRGAVPDGESSAEHRADLEHGADA